MKYLLVILVVALVMWALLKRQGPGTRGGPPGSREPRAQPQAMVECAHCGLHLPAADAVLDGSRVYCCEAHRRLGPRAPRA